jgi:hypothetical protein
MPDANGALAFRIEASPRQNTGNAHAFPVQNQQNMYHSLKHTENQSHPARMAHNAVLNRVYFDKFEINWAPKLQYCSVGPYPFWKAVTYRKNTDLGKFRET